MPTDTAPSVLYIEDDHLIARIVLSVVREAGYDVVHALSGAEAIEHFRSTAFDLIATDLVLPDMDGKNLIRTLKTIRPLPPTVVITGYGDEQTVVEVMRLGVTDYIPKDTDGRYVTLLPSIFEVAIYHGKIEILKRTIEKELHQSRENFRNLLNASKDFIFVIDGQGRILNYNPAFQEALGYSEAELRAMTVFDIHPADRREEMDRVIASMWEGEMESCSVPMIRKSGEVFEIETRTSNGRWGDEDVLYVISRDMTEQRKAEFAVEDSRHMLELVINSIPQHVFWKDRDLRFLGGNYNFARAVGLVYPKDLIGKAEEDMEPLVKMPPDWMDRQEHVVKTGIPEYRNCFKAKTLEGKDLILEISQIPLRDATNEIIGLLSTGDDITERVKMEEDLRHRENLLSIITTNMRDIVGLVDRNFKWIYLTPSHKDVLGRDAADLIGTSPLENIHPDERNKVRRAIALGVKERRSQRVEFRYLHNEGYYLWFECIGAPIFGANGEVESIVLASRDITDRKEADEELLERTRQLEESNQELDAFSHTVAHDLKNPLNSILGLSNLLREDIELSNDEIAESLMFIEQAATNMNGIIDSLMVLAGVRKQEIVLQELDMGEIVENTMGRLTFYVYDMNADIMIGELPKSQGFAPWIQEVWVNYITNAVKYGGKPPIVHIGGNVLEDGRVKYWVKDNGPGISEEDQKRLFVPFSRLRQVSVKGYGLGLSIVQRIIARLGGEVGIESTVGEGSLFYFILNPFVKQDQTVEQKSETA